MPVAPPRIEHVERLLGGGATADKPQDQIETPATARSTAVTEASGRNGAAVFEIGYSNHHGTWTGSLIRFYPSGPNLADIRDARAALKTRTRLSGRGRVA